MESYQDDRLQLMTSLEEPKDPKPPEIPSIN